MLKLFYELTVTYITQFDAPVDPKSEPEAAVSRHRMLWAVRRRELC